MTQPNRAQFVTRGYLLIAMMSVVGAIGVVSIMRVRAAAAQSGGGDEVWDQAAAVELA